MCPAAMLARAGLLLCLVVGSKQLSITEFEVPAALHAGEDAELRCRYDVGGESGDSVIVKWWWTPLNGDKSQLYQRIGRDPSFILSQKHNIVNKENDSIVLLAATPADSGVYSCEVTNNIVDEVRQQQLLTVFTAGNGLNLTITEVADGPDADTEEDVLIECRAEDVAPLPDLGLTVDSVVVGDMTEVITGPDSDGLYDIVGNMSLSKETVENNEVRCELYFVNRDITHPPYVVSETYHLSGALNTTRAPEDAPEPDAAPDSLQYPSGDTAQCRVTISLLLALGALTQLHALL